MIHDARWSSEDEEPKLTRWQQLDNPLLELRYANIVAGTDDARLVDADKDSVRQHGLYV